MYLSIKNKSSHCAAEWALYGAGMQQEYLQMCVKICECVKEDLYMPKGIWQYALKTVSVNGPLSMSNEQPDADCS